MSGFKFQIYLLCSMVVKSKTKVSTCLLCQTKGTVSPIQGPDHRSFFICSYCQLIFIDSTEYLQPSDEKYRYDQHNNDAEDFRYIAFLSRAIDPALPHISRGSRILDYGCGPSQALLLELGRRIDCKTTAYDPYYFPLVVSKVDPFDAIFSTEVFEHLYNPLQSIQEVLSLLKVGGVLTIMTELYPEDPKDFQNWYYAKDPTHVVFYSMKTLTYLQETFHLQSLYNDRKRVFIWRKIM